MPEKLPYNTAFPNERRSDSDVSILDYFAAAALPAMIEKTEPSELPAVMKLSDVIAQSCYSIARSMMKERENHQ